LIDLPGAAGPWVLQADAAAQKAGVKPHRAITSMNGKPVASVQAFRKQLREFTGEKLTVGQGETPLTLIPALQPIEIPVNASNLCYPFLLAELRLRQSGAKGDEEALLRLQQALALMHFRQYDKAMEVLRDARLGTSTGICQGTLDYYSGVNLLRLGTTYLAEAARSFNQSLKYPQATLFGPDGPMVSILARQALEDLKP
jgi:membrane-associated protease RseP (regulator of RpoE activity)